MLTHAEQRPRGARGTDVTAVPLLGARPCRVGCDGLACGPPVAPVSVLGRGSRSLRPRQEAEGPGAGCDVWPSGGTGRPGSPRSFTRPAFTGTGPGPGSRRPATWAGPRPRRGTWHRVGQCPRPGRPVGPAGTEPPGPDPLLARLQPPDPARRPDLSPTAAARPRGPLSPELPWQHAPRPGAARSSTAGRQPPPSCPAREAGEGGCMRLRKGRRGREPRPGQLAGSGQRPRLPARLPCPSRRATRPAPGGPRGGLGAMHVGAQQPPAAHALRALSAT